MSGIEPGSLPKPVSRTERRKWDDDDRRDAERHSRPNVPTFTPKFDDCTESAYRTHRFSLSARLGMTVCDFCQRPERECLIKP